MSKLPYYNGYVIQWLREEVRTALEPKVKELSKIVTSSDFQIKYVASYPESVLAYKTKQYVDAFKMLRIFFRDNPMAIVNTHEGGMSVEELKEKIIYNFDLSFLPENSYYRNQLDAMIDWYMIRRIDGYIYSHDDARSKFNQYCPFVNMTTPRLVEFLYNHKTIIELSTAKEHYGTNVGHTYCNSVGVTVLKFEKSINLYKEIPHNLNKLYSEKTYSQSYKKARKYATDILRGIINLEDTSGN